jgi:hypothetical protein
MSLQFEMFQIIRCVPKARFNDRDANGLMQLENNLFMARHCRRLSVPRIKKKYPCCREKRTKNEKKKDEKMALGAVETIYM